jgi:Xaa-Pro aminopeptidase
MRRRLLITIAAVWLCAPGPYAQRTGYPPEEFAARRGKLAQRLGHGTLLMFGSTSPLPGLRFRQDNDFYYLTGNESLNAALVLDADTGAAHLFLPQLKPAEIRYEGGNWLGERDAAARYQFTSIQPLADLHEFHARRRAVPVTST